MYIITESKNVEIIKNIRKDLPTYIITLDIFKIFKDLNLKINKILKSKHFIKNIPSELLKNPEYQYSEYILINILKSYYVKTILNTFNNDEEYMAWIDFGYTRSKNTLKNKKTLNLNFDKNKFHYFLIKDVVDVDIKRSMFNNDVYVTGSALVGTKEKWLEFHVLVNNEIYKLVDSGIIDDDQGIYLKILLENSNFFEKHIDEKEWFCLFNHAVV